MVGELFMGMVNGFLAMFPILSLPVGFAEGVGFLISIAGYLNIFLPLLRLAPILGLIVMIRNWNIMIALLRFLLRFIPFLDGG